MTIDRKATIKLFCTAIALAFLALPLLPLNQTGAQHIDVFNMPREKAAENKPQDVPEIVEVEVTDTFTYKVMVEKERLDEGNVFARELDIKALADEERHPTTGARWNTTTGGTSYRGWNVPPTSSTAPGCAAAYCTFCRTGKRWWTGAAGVCGTAARATHRKQPALYIYDRTFLTREWTLILTETLW